MDNEKRKELISMTDFVLENEDYVIEYHNTIRGFELIKNYANFLKQPLKLEMFVPHDEDGNVLNEPEQFKEWLKSDHYFNASESVSHQCRMYQKAKEKVLFNNFKSIGRFKVSSGFEDISILKYKNGNTKAYVIDYTVEETKAQVCYTIEDLIKFKLTLTENAKKLINL